MVEYSNQAVPIIQHLGVDQLQAKRDQPARISQFF